MFPKHIFIVGTAVIAAGFAACGRAERYESRTLAISEAEVALERWWQEIAPKRQPGPLGKTNREWLLKTTAWLPSEWPPTAETVWTRYGYGLDVSLDGSSGVSAPIARIERHGRQSKSAVFIPMSRKVKSIATQAVRPHGGWNYTRADEAAISSELLESASAPRDLRRVAAYYTAWRLGNGAIAAQVSKRHARFFSWLDAQVASDPELAGAKKR